MSTANLRYAPLRIYKTSQNSTSFSLVWLDLSAFGLTVLKVICVIQLVPLRCLLIQKDAVSHYSHNFFKKVCLGILWLWLIDQKSKYKSNLSPLWSNKMSPASLLHTNFNSQYVCVDVSTSNFEHRNFPPPAGEREKNSLLVLNYMHIILHSESQTSKWINDKQKHIFEAGVDFKIQV